MAERATDQYQTAAVVELRQQLAECQATLNQLRRSESKWQSVVCNVPVFAVLVDADDCIEFLNRAAPGMSVEEAIGKPVAHFLQPEFVDAAKSAMARVRQTGESTYYECMGAGPNGALAWYETHVGPVFVDGKLAAVSLIASDITVRKNAEAALQTAHEELEQRVLERTEQLRLSNEQIRNSEAQYRALVESSPDGVIMMDMTARIRFASPRAMQMHGTDHLVDVIGHPVSDFIAEHDRERLERNIQLLIQHGIRHNSEYRCLRRDGTTFPGETSAAVIVNSSGRPTALMALIRDITERKEAQQALLRILRASDRERELITYDIHDGIAQQLLGALMHFEAVETTLNGMSEENAITFAKGLSGLRAAAAEARNLMNRTRTPVLDKFGVRDAIADLINQLQSSNATPHITFRCEDALESMTPDVATAVFRIVQEAVTNACRHSQAAEVLVTIVRNHDELTVDVEDDGVGFDTADKNINRYGLDGIRERVRLLGRDLRIDSRPGHGTRISATLLSKGPE